MSQFKAGGKYRRNTNPIPAYSKGAALFYVTEGNVYSITVIAGTYIAFIDDVGDQMCVDHATFNALFDALTESEANPVVLPPVTPEEFMKVIQRLTGMESRIETLTGELDDAWSEIRDHRRALRHLGD